jgi:hypothetical protein
MPANYDVNAAWPGEAARSARKASEIVMLTLPEYRYERRAGVRSPLGCLFCFQSGPIEF